MYKAEQLHSDSGADMSRSLSRLGSEPRPRQKQRRNMNSGGSGRGRVDLGEFGTSCCLEQDLHVKEDADANVAQSMAAVVGRAGMK